MARRKLVTIEGPKATVTIYRDAEFDEYCIRRHAHGPLAEMGYDSDYYTKSKKDAYDTACLIVGLEPSDL